MSNRVKIGIVGTGHRARAFVRELEKLDHVEITCLCDVDAHRLNAFNKEFVHGSPRLVTDLCEMLVGDLVEGVIITVPDKYHADVAVQCFEAGKDVMLEKPMALNERDCRRIIQAKIKSGRLMQVGFVLRWTNFYRKLKELIDAGKFGQIMGINAGEFVGVDHSASFMRRWHRKHENSGSFLLSKCSHDLDILNWLVGSVPTHVASFGGNNYFLPTKQPATHCSKCDQTETCRYRYKGRFVYVPEPDRDNPTKGDFDLCVYNDDKDVIDNQMCMLEFGNGVRATFALQLFYPGPSYRHITVMGCDAYTSGAPGDPVLRLEFADGRPAEEYDVAQDSAGHGGGDERFTEAFIEAIRTREEPQTDLAAGLAATVVAAALENARRSMTVVQIPPHTYTLENPSIEQRQFDGKRPILARF